MIWGNTAWDGHRLGAQFLTEALAAHHDVLYVDPPTSIFRQIRTAGWRSLAGMSDPSTVADGIIRVRPLGPPGIRRAIVRTLTSAVARRQVRTATRKLGRPVRAVISGYLDVRPFGCCGEQWRVCRISDDFSVGSELGLRVDHLIRAQRRIARSSDAQVCVSQPLVDRWRGEGYDPVLIPNGCDVERLVAAGSAPRPTVIELDDPIVGYCGQLSRRIDLDLLEAVAEAGHPLLLVGGVRADVDRRRVDRLVARRNVQWLGARPYGELPALLTSMSVGLLPYTDSAFNRASFPLKLLEYLGAAAAPVSSDLPAVRWLGTDLVRIADDRAGFVDAVDAALRSAHDPVERQRRVDLAASHSWARRAESYLQVLDRLDAVAGGSQSSAP